jgi:hypothetical protein
MHGMTYKSAGSSCPFRFVHNLTVGQALPDKMRVPITLGVLFYPPVNSADPAFPLELKCDHSNDTVSVMHSMTYKLAGSSRSFRFSHSLTVGQAVPDGIRSGSCTA